MTDPFGVRHEEALELLDRALAYTRGALVSVDARDLGRPTPCAAWDLDALLAHMDDALEAFTEAADGLVPGSSERRAAPPASCAARIGALQAKACSLLGAWADPGAARSARIGGLRIATTYLVLAAALEITVHGWDVASALGRDHRVPDDLARRLLPVAASLVSPADRRRRFDDPLACPSAAPAGVRLLARLGRDAAAHDSRLT